MLPVASATLPLASYARTDLYPLIMIMILPLYIALHLTITLRHVVAILHRYQELFVVYLLVAVSIDVRNNLIRFRLLKRFSSELQAQVVR